MIRILAICGNGMGTSLVIKMKVKRFLDSHGVEGDMQSCSLGEAPGYLAQGVEIALCPHNLVTHLTIPRGGHLIGLKNILDEGEFGPLILGVLKEHFPQEIKE